MSEDELLAPSLTAKILNVAVGTLAVWRCTGRYDLPFYKVGKSVKYRRSDVERFLRVRRHVHTA
jgi:predicted site-specific integrase-resolvase